MGSSNPISEAADFAGDVIGGAADFVGDVAQEGIDIVKENPEIAAVALILAGLPPEVALTEAEAAAAAEAAAGTFGSSTAAEIAAAEAASAAAGGAGGITSIASGLTGPTAEDIAQKAIQNIVQQKAQEEITNMLKDTFMPDQGSPSNQPISTIAPPDTTTSTQGTSISPDIYSKGLGYLTYSGAPEYQDVIDIYNKPEYNFLPAIQDAFGVDTIEDAVKKYGPAVFSYLGYRLSKGDQKRINDITMGAYNKYNAGTELKRLQYTTGQGLPSLNITRGGAPLGSPTIPTAPMRTAANVVYKPVVARADGGIIDLDPEEFEMRKEFDLDKRRESFEDLMREYEYFKKRKLYEKKYPRNEAKNGGIMRRIKYAESSTPLTMPTSENRLTHEKIQTTLQMAQQNPEIMAKVKKVLPIIMSSMKKRSSMEMAQRKAKGGLINLLGKEMDLRASGGFVPIGKKERADDVPARLSKNEFVFTAKAVRKAGGGDINKGAKKMYALMKHLEKGGNL